MSAILTNIAYTVSFLCLLLAAHLATAEPANKLPSRLLSIGFIVLAVQSAIMTLNYGHETYFAAKLLPPLLALVFGPLVALCFQSAANMDFRLRATHAAHFIPAGIVLIQLSLKQTWLNIDWIIIASFAVYTAILGNQALKGPTQFAPLHRNHRVVHKWLVACTVVFFVSFVSELMIYRDILNGQSLVQSPALVLVTATKLGLIGLVLLNALNHRSYFDWLFTFGLPFQKPVTDPDALKQQQQLVLQYETLIKNEELFLETETSLKGISDRLNVSTRFLSQAINLVCGESHSKRMNRFRVTKAKKLILDAPDHSMLQIMYDAGFRTKSNFNKEFLAIEGVSPSAFREASLK